MISMIEPHTGKKAILCFLITFLLLQITVSAKAFNLRKINDAENLSSSHIFSIHQDGKGLMWIGTGRGVDVYDGKQVTLYNPKCAENFFTGCRIDRIEQTGENLFWLQTHYGLYAIDMETTALESFEMFNRIAFLDRDSSGNIYLVQGNNCIYYKLNDQKQFEQFFIPDLRANEIVNFFVDEFDRLWIFQKDGNNRCFALRVNERGSIRLDTLTGYQHPAGILYATNDGKHTHYLVDETLALYEFDTSVGKTVLVCDLKKGLSVGDEITSLVKFHHDYLIGLKNGGLSLLRKEDESYVFEEIDVPGSVNCLYKDHFQDMVWIGTMGSGVYIYSLDMYSIKSTCLSEYTSKISQSVSALLVDESNTLWAGTKGGGILRIYNYQMEKIAGNHRVELITASNSLLKDNVILSFGESRQNGFWIGSEQGLSYFSQKANRVSPIHVSWENKDVKSITDIYEQDSIVWLSTLGMGMIKATLQWHDNEPVLNAVKQLLVNEEDEFANHFLSIYSENDSILWCANKGEGVFRLNTVTSTLENIRFRGNTMNESNVIQKDNRGDYLIGTNAGLVKYTSEKRKLLDGSNGMPTSSVYAILADSPSGYWLSTNRGLIFYHTDTESFRMYDHHDGLSVLEFNEGASFKDTRNETSFFGGTNGFVSIKRNYFDEGQHYMPSVYFSTITIRDNLYPIETFLVHEGDRTFLTLSHEQNFFKITLAAIDHLNGNSYSFYYKLGNNREWTYNGNSDEISFADLHPGNYTLYVKYYNKVLGKESYIYKMDIRISPPWYASPWAYFVYALLLLVVILLIAGVWMMYHRKKKAEQQQKIEQQHKEEIYESKLQFFTNISHEFCTPLTLIYAPCNRLLAEKNLSESGKKYTSVIKQNAERLNSLIQDLIEFNRIESGYKKPVIAPVDITAIVGKLVESFTEMAESQAIVFEKEISPSVRWNSDKDFIITILLNLLSNAFKYTKNEKKVRVRVGVHQDHLCMVVSNTGKGIAEKDIPMLFDRYHILQHFELNDRFSSRNGLGLAISSNMVHLLGGTIEVESIPDEWTHFRVKLPYLESSLEGSEEEKTISLPNYNLEHNPVFRIPESDIDTLKPTILVVDDEIEIQWLLFDIFKDDYNVLTAVNPLEVMEMLKENTPDLIISDVVMQGADGLTFSRQVKEDKDTAHIPFILLSARRDMEVQTEGLNAGAEIYITKPFHVDYLKSSVRRLLERKESLREYFSSPLSLYTLEQGKLSDKEHKKFVNEILKIINKNIKDKDLSAHLIAEKMNIGLRSFYRKLEEADGINLTELINNCRLAKAADLLAKTKLTIDEVVFQSGFTNRSTFYRAFSKKYNCTPTEYRKDRKAVSGNV